MMCQRVVLFAGFVALAYSKRLLKRVMPVKPGPKWMYRKKIGETRAHRQRWAGSCCLPTPGRPVVLPTADVQASTSLAFTTAARVSVGLVQAAAHGQSRSGLWNCQPPLERGTDRRDACSARWRWRMMVLRYQIWDSQGAPLPQTSSTYECGLSVIFLQR